MRRTGPWAILGIDATDDRREVKRAYGRILKTIDVDADPAAFVRLREALEDALAWGSFRWDEDEAEEAAAEDSADLSIPPGDDDEAEDFDWEAWQTRVPPPTGGAVAALCQELDEALAGEAVPKPERVAALGEAILAHPDLHHLDRAGEVELWLAEAMAASFPRCDPLVDPAIDRFGWDQSASLRRDWSVERVVQRRDDLAFLAAASQPFHGHHAALQELRSPPRRRAMLWQLRLPSDVRQFLEILKERDTLVADLDAENLAWWRAHFYGPHLPPNFWLCLLGWTIFLTAVGAVVTSGGEGGAAPFFPVAGAAAILSFAGIFAWSRLAAAQRAQAEAAEYGEMRPEGAVRWAAGALLLPLVPVLAPPHPAVAAVASGTAAWLGWGLLRRGWTEPEWMGLPTGARLFLPGVAAAASLFGLAAMAPWRAAALVLPLAILSWAGSYGFRPFETWLLDAPRRLRVQAAGAGLALVLAALSAMVTAVGGWPPPAVLLAAIPVAIVAAHLLTAAGTIDVHIVEWPLRGLLVLGFILGRQHLPVPFFEAGFVLIALYGLGYALVRTAAVLRAEMQPPAAKAEG